MNTDFITINEIADDIYSHKIMRDLPFERIIRDTVELMKIVGCPLLFGDKEEVIEIDKWRAALPCDYYAVDQINLLDACSRDIAVFKESTGTFSPIGSKRGSDLVYKIQGKILYTSIPQGKVRMSYQALALDDEGFPKILNNASYIRALKSYIKMNWFTDLFDDGMIDEKRLLNAKTDYYNNITQAQNKMDIPDLAQMENLAIIMNDAFTRQHEFYNNFNDLNKKHKLRVH